MQIKPWFLSKTVLSSIVGFIIAILAIFHVNLTSFQAQIVDAVDQVAEATISVAVLVITIYGHISAQRKLVAQHEAILNEAQTPNGASASTPSLNSPTSKAAPLIGLCILGFVVGLTGCASSGASTAAGDSGVAGSSGQTPNILTVIETFIVSAPSMLASWTDSHPQVVQKAGYETAWLIDTFATQHDSTRANRALYIDASAKFLYSSATGQPLTTDVIGNGIIGFGGSGGAKDQAYAKAGSLVSEIVSPLTNALKGFPKSIINFLSNFAMGMQQYEAPLLTTASN